MPRTTKCHACNDNNDFTPKEIKVFLQDEIILFKKFCGNIPGYTIRMHFWSEMFLTLENKNLSDSLYFH